MLLRNDPEWYVGSTHTTPAIDVVVTQTQHGMTTTFTTTGGKVVGVPICPDLLSYEDIGAADNARGKVIRAFFWLIRWWRT